MSRFRATLAFAALMSPMAMSAQSDAALWRFVYPNAKALISIDWARIRHSQVGAMFSDKLRTASSSLPVPMPQIPGMEMLNDIDRILVSSPGNSSPDDTSQPPVLIGIHGHFEPAKVRELFAHLGAKPQAYDSFQVYRPQGKQVKEMAFTLFDNETILFGDAPSIFAALDRNKFGSSAPQEPPPAGSMMARAAEMEANYDFWAIMEATEILSNDSVAGLFRGAEWMADARGFEAGINLRAGLVADIVVHFASETAAKHMTVELTRLLGMAVKDKSAGAQVQEFVKKLKFLADGSAAKISLRLSQQDIEKSLKAFAASQKSSAQSAAKAKWSLSPIQPQAPIAIPAPAKPAVIRIDGLDDGPREIPYPNQQH